MDELIKNMEKSKVYDLVNMVEYQEGSIASLSLTQRPGVAMTMMAFDKGEAISTHAAPGDAFVQILDGEGEFTIKDVVYNLKKGDCVVMPAGAPHAVKAAKGRFKMLLTVVK